MPGTYPTSHSATDIRHGVEEKFWLAQAEQANLYSDHAQEALETVKVVCTIPSVRPGTNEFSLVPPGVCRRRDRYSRTERRLTRAHAAIEVGRRLFGYCGVGGFRASCSLGQSILVNG
jgi:hypothetical protein